MDEKLCSCYVLLSKHLGCSLSRRRAKRKLKRPGMKWRWGRPASLTGWSWWSDNNWQYKKSKQPCGLQRWKWSSSTFLSVDLANCPWRHCSNKWRAILLDTYYRPAMFYSTQNAVCYDIFLLLQRRFLGGGSSSAPANCCIQNYLYSRHLVGFSSAICQCTLLTP